MGRWAVALAVVAAMALTARADKLTEVPDPGPTLSLKTRLTKNFTLLSNEMGLHLKNLSGELIDMKFDIGGRRAKINLGGGDDERLKLRVNSNVVMRGKIARVSAKVDLGLFGDRFQLELPDFEIVPQTLDGRSWVEFRVPLIEGTF
jgi:hypothetical protein